MFAGSDRTGSGCDRRPFTSAGVLVWRGRSGVPEPIAQQNAQAFSLTADGDAAWVTGDVPAILSRPARSFEQFTADYAAAFT